MEGEMEKYEKLLVLDLDETLVHTTFNICKETNPDFSISDGYIVYLRPNVQKFLDFCFSHYEEVMIWTAGTYDYALEVINKFYDSTKFVKIWDRKRCSYQRDLDSYAEYWRKDIRKLTRLGYDKEKILCIDDTPLNFAKSYGNLISVHPFDGDPKDTELGKLQKYLEYIGPLKNIRSINKLAWRSHI